jgi:hypothetical protein
MTESREGTPFFYTVEEFREIEQRYDGKVEYYNGYLFFHTICGEEEAEETSEIREMPTESERRANSDIRAEMRNGFYIVGGKIRENMDQLVELTKRIYMLQDMITRDKKQDQKELETLTEEEKAFDEKVYAAIARKFS